MSLSYIDQPESYTSFDSPRKNTKSHNTSQILSNKEESPQPIHAKRLQITELTPQPFHTTYVFPEVNLTRSEKQKVLLKLKNYYARKHPGFSVQKYMNTEVPSNQENMLEKVLQPDYEDTEAVNKLKYQQTTKRFRENNLYNAVPPKVDTNRRVQPLREHSPQQTTIPNSTPLLKTPQHTLEKTIKGTAFITEQTEDSYDMLDFKQGPRIATENSSLNRGNRNGLHHEFRSGPRLRSERQSFHNTSKYSFMSFDMMSETSKVSNFRGREPEIYIPKEYSVDKASKFQYLYQKFKDPQVRVKSCLKRLGSVNDYARSSAYGGFNRENTTRHGKIALSKIDENKYESGFSATLHYAKNNISENMDEIDESGRKHDIFSKLNTTVDSNKGTTRENLKRKLLKMDIVEKEDLNGKREAYKRARREHGRSKTNEIQSKPMDQSLRALKSLFDEYANIKIEYTMKEASVVTPL